MSSLHLQDPSQLAPHFLVNILLGDLESAHAPTLVLQIGPNGNVNKYKYALYHGADAELWAAQLIVALPSIADVCVHLAGTCAVNCRVTDYVDPYRVGQIGFILRTIDATSLRAPRKRDDAIAQRDRF